MENIEYNRNLINNSPAYLASVVTNGEYQIPEHIKYLEQRILSSLKKGNARLIINMPPRHGKSEYISKYLPFWYLCNFPDERIILSSYGKEFASAWGLNVKSLISEFAKELFDIEINPMASASHNFKIQNHNGGMVCVGSKGQLTGRGANLLIIDDPIKNDAEAMSPKMRENLWNWFKATAMTRLEPNGNLILLMTRWHIDDLCGRIEKELNNDIWEIIKLPAFAEKDDLIYRKENEPLWEQRYDIDALNLIRNSLGSFWFEALYQQNPVPASGTLFKLQYFKYYEKVGNLYIINQADNNLIDIRNIKFFATMDLAISNNTKSDYTVIIHFGVDTESNIFITNVFRMKMESSNHQKLVLDFYYEYKPLIIGIENVQYQSTLIQNLIKFGLPIKSIRPDKDKYSRALAMQSKHENGKIFFPKNTEWLYEFEKELLSFPNSEHDDQVDAFAYIANIIDPISSNKPVGIDYDRRFKKSLTRNF